MFSTIVQYLTINYLLFSKDATVTCSEIGSFFGWLKHKKIPLFHPVSGVGMTMKSSCDFLNLAGSVVVSLLP